MSLLKYIEHATVISTAISLIDNAKSEICVTSLLSEKEDLPPSYVDSLQRKLKSGIRMTRIYFGSNELFKEELLKSDVKDLVDDGLSIIHCTDEILYQRMIIVDEERVLFAIKDQKQGKHVLLSNKRVLAKAFKEYFNSVALNSNAAPL